MPKHMENPAVTAAKMYLSMITPEPASTTAEGVAKLNALKQFVASLTPETVDSVVLVSLLIKGEGELCVCGERHGGSELDINMFGSPSGISAMLLIASAAHGDALREIEPDITESQFQHAGGRATH